MFIGRVYMACDYTYSTRGSRRVPLYPARRVSLVVGARIPTELSHSSPLFNDVTRRTTSSKFRLVPCPILLQKCYGKLKIKNSYFLSSLYLFLYLNYIILHYIIFMCKILNTQIQFLLLLSIFLFLLIVLNLHLKSKYFNINIVFKYYY